MHTPFTPPQGPLEGHPHGGGLGFGFSPVDRRVLHEQRRAARRGFRDAIRGHDTDADSPFDGNFRGGFGPGFGRGFGGPGFGGPGFGGPGFGGRGPRGGGRGRGRGRRGDVRAAILVLLAERPMHGYEMIQQIAERTQDLWKPSPGSVYPTLQLLVDEDLIVGTESDGSKKLFELTDTGRAAAEKIETPPWEEITEGADPGHADLRNATGQLMRAVAMSAGAASPEQQKRIADIVNNARREIYGILGESE
ncbi:PadR family transcriptional regulator [Mycobacterium antarcticum]|uniref:PadR family transcriptional regulator n=1 Tax=unclassified Mycolicibacterium TaxID=2636767 RepID=UPI00239370F6|nr:MULTISPECIES: PadR family transcriptional regulator [unclassified Mycolicibacterium]BDX29942.1 PadR family transcriptional regulator [Mycolicibacterium sp. TUM20985]GLP73364.1 PadR family transcriptional regulator [Mycolicibacterium sp. TUM20983]GLP79078.1 PadR family transcriptional regulator [Mycolicibacterium sp. TUM20984]